jgi:hypothetical protein
MAEILEPRLEARRAGDSAGDMLDAWVDRTEEDAKKPVCDTTVNMDMTLFALEDILGGHSACANVALRALIDLGTNPGEQVQGPTRHIASLHCALHCTALHCALHCTVQAALRTDLAARLEGGQFSLKDKHRLPRATAAFFETVGGCLLTSVRRHCGSVCGSGSACGSAAVRKWHWQCGSVGTPAPGPADLLASGAAHRHQGHIRGRWAGLVCTGSNAH